MIKNEEQKNKSSNTADISLTRITRTIYFAILVIAITTVLFDSGNLLSPEAITDRWILLSGVFVVNTIAWYFGSQNSRSRKIISTYVLAVVLLIFSGFMTYYERGMASNSTIFYILPILVIATLKNRHALLATGVLAGVTYSVASVKYFNDFFNEGYRIQLWGNILLYFGTFLACAWLVMIVAGLRRDSK